MARARACVCVCVWERERERENVCVCMCFSDISYWTGSHMKLMGSLVLNISQTSECPMFKPSRTGRRNPCVTWQLFCIMTHNLRVCAQLNSFVLLPAILLLPGRVGQRLMINTGMAASNPVTVHFHQSDLTPAVASTLASVHETRCQVITTKTVLISAVCNHGPLFSTNRFPIVRSHFALVSLWSRRLK